jgi:tetratricopeptide (TPR) repeat protein
MTGNGRFLSRTALAVALALGIVAAGSLIADPAQAARKKNNDGGLKLSLSPEFQKAIVKADGSIKKNDYEAAKADLAAAEQAIASNDDRYQYHAIALNLGLALKDQDMQVNAVRGMVDTGLVPQEQIGQFATIAADAAFRNKEYDAAIAYARQAEAVGYQPGQVYPIIAQAQWGKAGTGNLSSEPARSLVVEGLANFKKGIDALKAAGQEVPVQWYQVATGKAEAAGLPQVSDWAQMAFEADPSGANLRTILRIFQRDHPEMSNRENLDLLRLMHWSGGMALPADYLEYAEMAGKSGVYGEVKSVIDKGRSEGILSAGEGGAYYSTATEQMAGDRASLPSAEADARKAATGKIAAATGDAYLGYGNYAKAIEMYELALQKGSIDTDEVNTRLGIAMARNGNTAGAIEALGKVQAGVRGKLAKYWSNYVQRRAAPVSPAAPATPAS